MFSANKRRKRKQAAFAKRIEVSKARKISYGWGIAACVVALVVSLLVLFLVSPYKETLKPIFSVLISIGIGYGIFSMIYCILSGSYIGDVFLWCAGLTVKFPGLIFSWDLDGLMWLIGMKILFAILGFLVGVGALLLAIVLSAILSIVSFPFIVVLNEKHDYDNALF